MPRSRCPSPGRSTATRMMMPAPIRTTLLCLAGLAFAGCGGEPARDDAAVAGEYDTLGGGPPGGVVVVLADREPDHLNPLTFNSVPAYHAVHLMFRALAG